MRRRRVIGGVLICLAVLAVAAGVIYSQQLRQKEEQITAGNSHNVGSGYREIVYNGERYRYNNLITTILYAGVDSQGKMEATEKYGDKGNADSIALVVLDEKNHKMSIVFISRDTMTDIRQYSISGNDRGLYQTHLGYAYNYGDGGKVSCQNVCEAVSLLFGGIPVKRYVVTNQDSMSYINSLAGGITVTVPNDDLVENYPQLYQGAVVTLTDEIVRPYLQYRDTAEDFSNDGRMERQKTFVTSYVNRIKTLSQNQLEKSWNDLDQMKDYLQTNITRDQYLGLVEALKKAEFSDDSYISLPGTDQQGELHDEFYVDEAALQELIVQLFYEKE